MKPRTRLFAILTAASAAIVIVAVLLRSNGPDVHASAGAPPPVLDKMKLTEGAPAAPEIAFTDASGKSFTLADFKGRYMLVNLWATWCGPCIVELPELAELHKQLPQDRIAVVAVDVLERLDAAKLGEFLAMHEAADLPVHIDANRATQRGFVANELPLTVLIDGEGREVARAAGGQKWADPAVIEYLKAISALKP